MEVHSLIEFKDFIFAATDRGLYFYDDKNKIMKPVPFAKEDVA